MSQIFIGFYLDSPLTLSFYLPINTNYIRNLKNIFVVLAFSFISKQ